MRLGTNLANIRNYRDERFQPFSDAMKSCRKPMRIREDGSLDWNQTDPLTVDNNGYPVERSGPWAVEVALPDGVTLSDYKVRLTGNRVAADPTHELTAIDDKGILRVYTEPTKVDILPVDPHGTFRQPFVESIAGMRVLRFMDWGRTNKSVVKNWTDRNTPDGVTQSTSTSQGDPQGTALEHMIELCNATSSDLWVCVPHQATDAYVTEMLFLIKATLNPDLKVYIEYSNEVWNSGFDQYHYCKEKGNAIFQTGNNFRDAMLYHGRRTIQMSNLASRIFGEPSNRYRIVFGAGRKQTDSWKKPLEYDYNGNRLGDYIDYVAVAYYAAGHLGNENSSSFRDRGVDPATITAGDILEEFSWSVEMNGDRIASIASSDNIASFKNRHGAPLSLVAYEGGHHLDVVKMSNSSDKIRLEYLFAEVIRRPEITALYARMFYRWAEATNDGLFVVFQGPGIKYGSNGNFFSYEPGDVRHAAMLPYLGPEIPVDEEPEGDPEPPDVGPPVEEPDPEEPDTPPDEDVSVSDEPPDLINIQTVFDEVRRTRTEIIDAVNGLDSRLMYLKDEVDTLKTGLGYLTADLKDVDTRLRSIRSDVHTLQTSVTVVQTLAEKNHDMLLDVQTFTEGVKRGVSGDREIESGGGS